MTDIPERVIKWFGQNRSATGLPLYEIDQAGCWDWQRALNTNGYGVIGWRGDKPGTTIMLAHRVAYIIAGHTIGPGLEIDHLCRNRRCINPTHLEAVTGEENNNRGNPPHTHCCRGHEMVAANVYVYNGARHCRACKGERRSERKAKGLSRY